MIKYYRGGRGTYRVDNETVEMSGGKVLFVSGNTSFGAEQDLRQPPDMVALRFRYFSNATGEPLSGVCEPFWFLLAPQECL